MRRFLATFIALALGLSAVTLVLLPRPAAAPVPPSFTPGWPVVRGAYHVHSQQSDGTGTLDEIAAAAARAGLHYVIVTDHGDGTRELPAPAYRSGVLCLSGVEISTDGGHYVALGLARTPYPLAGHSRDVVEDVRRFGGFGFAAHPGSPKPELRWSDWEVPFDGVEWLNADSEWRDEFWGHLGGVLLTYAFRPAETLAGLLDRPEAVLEQWDRLTARRRVPAIAGADAHARLGFGRAREPYDDRVVARLPAYEVSFRAFLNHVILDGPLTGDAAFDARHVLSSIREGRLFTSIDGSAGLSAFEVVAGSGTKFARPGEYLDLEGPAMIEARVSAPEGTQLVMLRNGAAIYDAIGSHIRVDVGSQPGAYRIEARLPARLATGSVPWLMSNPIYVGLRGAHQRAAAPAALPPITDRTGFATTEWLAEASDGSTSALTAELLAGGMPALKWQFSLAGTDRRRQYAALRFPVGRGLAGQDRIQLRLQSDAPRRLWVQIRAPGGEDGQRWGRTLFADDRLTSVDLRFADFRRLDAPSSEPVPLDRMDSVLLVVDTLNSVPGARGTVWISDLWLAR